jgi:RNA polymerase sigma factor (sigma-70 family)
MKSYDIKNYVRYKKDIKSCIAKDDEFINYSRDDLIVKFLPLVEKLAKKFSTREEVCGILTISDMMQEGSIGLIKAVDRLDLDVIKDSNCPEKTIKSFLSKRIKGAIRRAIDINRGSIRIPEYKLIDIRNNPNDPVKMEMFFNSIFASLDEDNDKQYNNEEDDDYHIIELNDYLLILMKKFLTADQYKILNMHYGLSCEKSTSAEIAKELGITVATAAVRVSQLKKEAIDILIENAEYDDVISFTN